MTQSEAADKIRKLLNTSGRTDAEADTARTLAEALAYKFQVDLTSIRDSLGHRDAITNRVLGTWSKIPQEAALAGRIVRNFFDVLIVTQEGYQCQIYGVGTASQLDIAEYVFRFVVDEFRRQWNHKRGRCRKRADFMQGLYDGLRVKMYLDVQRLKAREPEVEAGHSAIVLDQEAAQRAHFEAHFGKLTTTQVKPRSAHSKSAQRGAMLGRHISVNPGIRGQTVDALPG